MKQLFVDYMIRITSLDIYVKEIEDLMLQPTFLSKALESLTLRCIGSKDCAVEVMLTKHAKNLNSLKVIGLKSKLIVPALPLLDSLALSYIDKDAMFDFIEASRQSISCYSVGIILNNNNTTNTAVYKIPNLQNLEILSYKAIEFAILNADHIVSLNLRQGSLVSKDIVWPKFPKLRQITMRCCRDPEPAYLKLLMSSRETVECLVTHYISHDVYAIELPKLTDLFVIGSNLEFVNKILSANQKSLKFLFLYDDPGMIDDNIKMERMRKVLIYSKYNEQINKRMEKICPNADVVFVNKVEFKNLMTYRFKRRNFLFESSNLS
jgi:hypothetical protein